MPVGMMMIVMMIQHPCSNELYDFSTYIQGKLHEGLLKVRKNQIVVEFNHYSLLGHLILFQNKVEWVPILKINMFDPNEANRW